MPDHKQIRAQSEIEAEAEVEAERDAAIERVQTRLGHVVDKGVDGTVGIYIAAKFGLISYMVALHVVPLVTGTFGEPVHLTHEVAMEVALLNGGLAYFETDASQRIATVIKDRLLKKGRS
jgi:hypothetical protein